MEDKISLDDFFINKVVKVNSADDIDTTEDHYLFVGSVGCPHSQLGTAHYETACNVKKFDGGDRKCYGLDLSKEGARTIAEKIGIPEVQGVPTTLKFNASEQKYENLIGGRLMSHQFDKLFKDSENSGLD